MEKRNYRIETLGIHGGLQPDPSTGARSLPIYQSNAFQFENSGHAANLFDLQEEGYIYTRIGNPTVSALEQRMADLEGGVGALATASGMSAILLSILNIAESGDEIVSASTLYGGTYNLFAVTLPKYGIKTRFVDPEDPQAFREAINSNTKAIYAETIGNPGLHVLDIEKTSQIAREAGLPLIIDNTFATPYLCRPIEHGADIVIHSATKWLGGNGTTMGGVIVDGGKFDWQSDKFPEFNRPDESYHGLTYAKDLGEEAYILKARVQMMRDLGPAMSPFNAFQLSLGLETLHVRMKEHVNNARDLVKYLESHPGVEWVLYPELDSHPSRALAEKYLPKGAGSVLVFGIKGGREAGAKVIDNVKLWSHVANVGDAKSLIIHPASTTHRQLSDEDLKTTGVTEDMIRLSVGIEHIDDITADLQYAIEEANGYRPVEKTAQR
ncbi:O-acetylhomoserine aminocarboxypropyltransferase/cysteine synthase family protein [Bacillus marinisedimentorum]|uniref:O-acetylhomoserine aminocarboxypropyltransferase/cysteine synthase family protein n=1 Tax=Bacillus marinisedimentorum TaxID=1821260 RepID=UPI0007E26E0A|nr:O-acetylhomoserine aminocarboxypropyltransferase/cysteine synthase family protein [Bacillus marinisedimentorum]